MTSERAEIIVHLVRHGRTAWNVDHRTMGWLDERIEPGWHAAAAAVGGVLEHEAVDRVISSPLARAIETAEPLAAALGMDIERDESFGELRVGDWEGLREDEIAVRWPDEWALWRSDPAALRRLGRETLAELNGRVAEALDGVAGGLYPGRAAVVFTHDAVVRAAVAWALSVGPEIYRHVQVDNCSITTVAVSLNERRVVRTNDTCHLAGLVL
ncbi:MAG TPA: histidine phosphatase family protein [Actinomycetota bacterium]|nr:histidine phosphatase family protein [Actinomycetota bacterium]